MAARTHTFKGCMAALITPFCDGELDAAALDRLVDLQLAEGTDGLVLCGTTAESPTLSEAEQARIIEQVLARVAGRCPIIVGSGSNCTARSVRASQQARALGADGIMLVSPYYNKPTQEGLRRHFSTIAERVDAAVILYNIPGRCGVEIELPTLCRLFEDHDNIVAVKHATGSVEGAVELRAACDIDILSGDDPLTFPLMQAGACGVISVLANLLPGRMRSLTSAMLAGDVARAETIHASLSGLANAMLSLATNPLPIKTALALRGLVREEFRLPMCPMDTAARHQLVEELRRAGLIETAPHAPQAPGQVRPEGTVRPEGITT